MLFLLHNMHNYSNDIHSCIIAVTIKENKKLTVCSERELSSAAPLKKLCTNKQQICSTETNDFRGNIV